MLPYALAILLSSFLLFAVQPMIARLLLPWFGGSATVWTVCMLFFQCGLLLGYLYAHWLALRLAPRRQVLLHGLLLAIALPFLPVAVPATLRPGPATEPTLRLLLTLTVAIGLPYFLLSSTAPLVQAWLSRARPQADPYRLYAVSNFGSMAALLSYPLLIEPRLDLGAQRLGWSWGFVGFAVLCLAAGLLSLRGGAGEPARPVSTVPPAAASSPVGLWMLLAAVPSFLLLGVTTYITQDLAPVPLLWVAPLALYLLSFILNFGAQSWYRRRFVYPALALLLLPVVLGAEEMPAGSPLLNVAIHSAAFFLIAWACHGELAALRPPPERLTGYYLCLAGGGALGGAAAAIGAPLLLAGNFEYPIGIGLACATLTWMLARAPGAAGVSRRPLLAALPAALITLLVAFGLFREVSRTLQGLRGISRNFYGELRVLERGEPDSPVFLRILQHGSTLHGYQFQHPTRLLEPTAYYCRSSGIGQLLLSRAPGEMSRIGVIGLGTGTLAAYGRPGDRMRFYELNPRVPGLARTEFQFLARSAAQIEIVTGDARLSLEHEPPQQFDLLVVDAFSGDAVPIHLLTREAVAIYQRHLRPGAVLAFHISNRYLNLEPVLELAALEAGLRSTAVVTDRDDQACTDADWVLLSSSPARFDRPPFSTIGRPAAIDLSIRPWTDQFSGLFQVIRQQ
jgi:SAM-dependent methyltransferase